MLGLAILAAAVVAIAAALLLSAALLGGVSRRRRISRARSILRAMRGPSGQPFFPETAEQKRREARLLADWDPTYGNGEGTDPDRW